ncbi:MAG: SUMF1/EgtB/PvdO family nonheme iron enzyme [Prevotella sp.]|nr:SUMF1/EgtB/PvdO family nonheme iron enzyme [Prevotella sp.]
MRRILDALKWFFTNPTCVFCLGLAVVLTATTIEILRGRATNFYDYYDATNMFWAGISPYSLEFIEAHSIWFLYTPVFTTIYAPIFLLPEWLGPFVWNGFNYCMLCLAIKTLPQPLAPYRMKIFLFLLLLILQSTFCFQYNMVVCYIFLFAFTLLENGKPFWATLLIMISATTKYYGAIELGLLLCYPKFWRNMGYALFWGVVLLLLPTINTAFDNVFVLYKDMWGTYESHRGAADYPGLFYAPGLKSLLLPNLRIVQLSVLVLIGAMFFWLNKRWSDFRFRVETLAVMMGYIILFSDSPETHTYMIALSGYMMAFWLQPQRSKFDWILFWLLFVNFCILPVDALCPTPVYRFFHNNFWLDVYCMAIAWIRVIWWAVKPKRIPFPAISRSTIIITLLLCAVGIHAQDRHYRINGVRFTMKYVEGGTFMMGASDNDSIADSDEKPAHKVTVGDFYIGETEVTQELWKAVMGKNPAKIKGENWPIENVSYKKCLEFVEKLSEMTGRHFRLPTEAEWEYAAIGGKYSKGYLYAGSNDVEKVAWLHNDTLWARHMPVASKQPNELGIYDMSGGVWEWCDTPYEPYSGDKGTFFTRLIRSRFKVVRGSGFRGYAKYARVSNRYCNAVWRNDHTIGLRIAMQL